MKNKMKKLLIGLSVLLNIVVGYVVIGIANGNVPPLVLKFMSEADHQRWLSQFEALSVQNGDVVILGDSITRGGSWHELFPNSPVRNRGIGGDTTRGVLARLHQVTSGKPSQVFLLIGTNDLTIGESDEAIVNNISTIVDRLATESPETQVFVQSILPRSDGYRERVETLNDKLRLAIEDRAEWIELYSLMVDEDGSIADLYSNDELHLHGAGYAVWVDAIANRV